MQVVLIRRQHVSSTKTTAQHIRRRYGEHLARQDVVLAVLDTFARTAKADHDERRVVRHHIIPAHGREVGCAVVAVCTDERNGPRRLGSTDQRRENGARLRLVVQSGADTATHSRCLHS